MILKGLLDARPPGDTALLASGREPHGYGRFSALAEDTCAALRRRGLIRNDKLAIVLPNGPDMAAAFVACACAVTAAPLNPAYREDEFHFYMDDLKAKALLVEEGSASPAIAAARRLGIPVLTASPRREAGAFTITGDAVSPPSGQGYAEGGDVALVLHTSGTTSRPKIVPLTHANLLASANNIRNTLQLTEADRCLNIMPLFHIHGLVAAILATLAAGASVFATPGFNALKFFGQMEEARPTWVTAVPTMHQAILARAGRNADIIKANPLRFIRSSSASLPVPVFHALEETFGCPVIEAYAMTENAHQMASNRLPPGKRKPGFVGCAAGPEVAVMSADGRLLGAGEEGEVVTRGPNVTPGYENNPKANEAGFAFGWFHTGDQGCMDGDGYLKITGRLKEIINRGGEKVAPMEVDEVLMAHEAVAQAVTFAMPHDRLGEEVAAAVVLREGQSATERELQDFANGRLAAFKAPKKIVILDEIPKGATGKLQRIGLAQKLGLA
ncbi:acyl--CoA ligase [Aestuariivirga sp.]|uniref:acyl--CoA ligase n=1 Tax=Aestuariivirga sp. TaxID=2650926 RepID=UPI0025BBF64F|nr:acyl--CoA ligase [Aestuariivirga sp.]MCA3556059.1 AMP-binding protein [Aestuariivirga sp.]